MSLILEALRKSEKARHGESRSVIPLIVSPRHGIQKTRRHIPVIPVALIVVATGLLLASFILTSDKEETAKPVASPVAKITRPAARPQQKTVNTYNLSQSSIKQSQRPVSDVQSDRQRILQQAGILPEYQVMKVPKRLSSYGTNFQRSVAPLHLDFHVYSSDRSRRVIFINGSEYGEGEQIKRDLDIVRIIPEGAVLEWQGERFLLTTFD